jgi:hypothetical protein
MIFRKIRETDDLGVTSAQIREWQPFDCSYCEDVLERAVNSEHEVDIS